MSTTSTLTPQLGHPRILVLGDAMLDRYTSGSVERVSPEAPVLVLNATDREVRLGGAASVALLARSLEAEVTLASVTGDDHDGRTLRRLLDEAGINASVLLSDPSRPTTVKERFLGRSEQRQSHQIVRVDTESRLPLNQQLEAQLVNSLARLIPEHDAVLISDYGKGVCAKSLVGEIISICQAAGRLVLVDPARGADFSIYSGATLLKPNRSEAELAMGRPIRSPDEARAAAIEMRRKYFVDIAFITLDRDGLVFATDERNEHHSIRPTGICDITGAGDTVLATLGLCFAAKLPLPDCADLANITAGLQVAQPGVTPISRAELLSEFYQSSPVGPSTGEPVAETSTANRARANTKTVDCASPLIPSPRRSGERARVRGLSSTPFARKLISPEAAERLAAEYRRDNKTIVFTNGCFDLLHVGHIAMLEEAAKEGDILFVAINDDASIKRLKGTQRPVVAEHDRARMLSALACVDHVLIFNDDTPHRLLAAIRPDVLVKGGTTSNIVGRELVEKHGGRVHKTGDVAAISTTRLLSQLRSTNSRLEEVMS